MSKKPSSPMDDIFRVVRSRQRPKRRSAFNGVLIAPIVSPDEVEARLDKVAQEHDALARGKWHVSTAPQRSLGGSQSARAPSSKDEELLQIVREVKQRQAEHALHEMVEFKSPRKLGFGRVSAQTYAAINQLAPTEKPISGFKPVYRDESGHHRDRADTTQYGDGRRETSHHREGAPRKSSQSPHRSTDHHHKDGNKAGNAAAENVAKLAMGSVSAVSAPYHSGSQSARNMRPPINYFVGGGVRRVAAPDTIRHDDAYDYEAGGGNDGPEYPAHWDREEESRTEYLSATGEGYRKRGGSPPAPPPTAIGVSKARHRDDSLQYADINANGSSIRPGHRDASRSPVTTRSNVNVHNDRDDSDHTNRTNQSRGRSRDARRTTSRSGTGKEKRHGSSKQKQRDNRDSDAPDSWQSNNGKSRIEPGGMVGGGVEDVDDLTLAAAQARTERNGSTVRNTSPRTNNTSPPSTNVVSSPKNKSPTDKAGTNGDVTSLLTMASLKQPEDGIGSGDEASPVVRGLSESPTASSPHNQSPGPVHIRTKTPSKEQPVVPQLPLHGVKIRMFPVATNNDNNDGNGSDGGSPVHAQPTTSLQHRTEPTLTSGSAAGKHSTVNKKRVHRGGSGLSGRPSSSHSGKGGNTNGNTNGNGMKGTAIQKGQNQGPLQEDAQLSVAAMWGESVWSRDISQHAMELMAVITDLFPAMHANGTADISGNSAIMQWVPYRSRIDTSSLKYGRFMPPLSVPTDENHRLKKGSGTGGGKPFMVESASESTESVVWLRGGSRVVVKPREFGKAPVAGHGMDAAHRPSIGGGMEVQGTPAIQKCCIMFVHSELVEGMDVLFVDAEGVVEYICSAPASLSKRFDPWRPSGDHRSFGTHKYASLLKAKAKGWQFPWQGIDGWGSTPSTSRRGSPARSRSHSPSNTSLGTGSPNLGTVTISPLGRNSPQFPGQNASGFVVRFGNASRAVSQVEAIRSRAIRNNDAQSADLQTALEIALRADTAAEAAAIDVIVFDMGENPTAEHKDTGLVPQGRRRANRDSELAAVGETPFSKMFDETERIDDAHDVGDDGELLLRGTDIADSLHVRGNSREGLLHVPGVSDQGVIAREVRSATKRARALLFHQDDVADKNAGDRPSSSSVPIRELPSREAPRPSTGNDIINSAVEEPSKPIARVRIHDAEGAVVRHMAVTSIEPEGGIVTSSRDAGGSTHRSKRLETPHESELQEGAARDRENIAAEYRRQEKQRSRYKAVRANAARVNRKVVVSGGSHYQQYRQPEPTLPVAPELLPGQEKAFRPGRPLRLSSPPIRGWSAQSGRVGNDNATQQGALHDTPNTKNPFHNEAASQQLGQRGGYQGGAELHLNLEELTKSFATALGEPPTAGKRREQQASLGNLAGRRLKPAKVAVDTFGSPAYLGLAPRAPRGKKQRNTNNGGSAGSIGEWTNADTRPESQRLRLGTAGSDL